MSKRIMVVDDEQYIRDFLMLLLEEEGYEVDCARHGLEALEKLAESSPDLILMDMMMPYLDGYGMIAALSQRGIDIPVLVLTASSMAFREAAKLIGKEYCMMKPIDGSALLDRVQRFTE